MFWMLREKKNISRGRKSANGLNYIDKSREKKQELRIQIGYSEGNEKLIRIDSREYGRRKSGCIDSSLKRF